MLRLALMSLRGRPGRLLTSALAVVIGVSFLAGSYIVTGTLGRVFDDLFRDINSGTDVQIRAVAPPLRLGGPYDSGRPVLPLSIVDPVRAVQGVAGAEGVVGGYGQLVGSDGKAVANRVGPTFAVSWNPDPAITPWRISQGRAPVTAGEIAVDRTVFRLSGLSVGAKTQLLTSKGPKPVTIVGVARFGAADSGGVATTVFLDRDTALQWIPTRPGLNAVRVRAVPGVDPVVLRDRLEAALRGSLSDGPRLEFRDRGVLLAETGQGPRRGLAFFEDLLSAFAAIAFVVAVLVITNTFSILITQRSRELALLRAIGARRRQILGAVCIEATVAGLVASLLGLLGGYGLAAGITSLLRSFGIRPPAEGLVIPRGQLAFAVLIGVIVTVVASIVPAIRASRTSPISAMRESSIDRSGGANWRPIVGVVLVVLGSMSYFWGVRGKAPSGREYAASDAMRFLGAGSGLVLLAVVIAGPWLVGPIIRLIGSRTATIVAGFAGLGLVVGAGWLLLSGNTGGVIRPLAIIAGLLGGGGLALTARTALGVPGRIARENTRRTPGRTSGSAVALTVGVALVGALIVLAGSISTTITGAIEDGYEADFIVVGTSFQGFSPVAGEAAAALPEVVASSPLRFGRLGIDIDAATLAAAAARDAAGETPGQSSGDSRDTGEIDSTLVLGVSPALVSKVLDLGRIQGRLEDLVQPETVAASQEWMTTSDHAIGDTVPIVSLSGAAGRLVRIVAVFETNTVLSGADFLVDVKGTLGADLYPFEFGRLLLLKPGTDKAAFRAEAEAAIADVPNAVVRSKAQFVEEQLGQVDLLLGLILVFLVLAFVIAALGIANTLALAVLERTREIGLLRAIGATRVQLGHVLRWEGILVALLGTTIGLAIGVVTGVGLVRVLDRDPALVLSIPWERLGLVVIVAAGLGLLASVFPARRAARLDIVRAIAAE